MTNWLFNQINAIGPILFALAFSATVVLAFAVTWMRFLTSPRERLHVATMTLASIVLLPGLFAGCAYFGWSIPLPKGLATTTFQTSTTTSPDERIPVMSVPASPAIESSSKTAPMMKSQVTAANATLMQPTNGLTSTYFPSVTFTQCLTMAYIAMAAVGITFWIVGLSAIRKLRRSLYPLPSDLKQQLADDLSALPARTEVFVSQHVKVPVACGLWRSQIVLPESMANESLDKIRWAIHHEQRHIENCDLWRWAIASALHALLWPHPLWRMLRREIRVSQDILADAGSANEQSRIDYAEWLVHISTRAQAVPAGALAMAEKGNSLTRRIHMLLSNANPAARISFVRRILSGAMILAVCFCIAILLAPKAASANPSNGSNEKDQPTNANKADEKVQPKPEKKQPQGKAELTNPPAPQYVMQLREQWDLPKIQLNNPSAEKYPAGSNVVVSGSFPLDLNPGVRVGIHHMEPDGKLEQMADVIVTSRQFQGQHHFNLQFTPPVDGWRSGRAIVIASSAQLPQIRSIRQIEFWGGDETPRPSKATLPTHNTGVIIDAATPVGIPELPTESLVRIRGEFSDPSIVNAYMGPPVICIFVRKEKPTEQNPKGFVAYQSASCQTFVDRPGHAWFEIEIKTPKQSNDYELRCSTYKKAMDGKTLENFDVLSRLVKVVASVKK